MKTLFKAQFFFHHHVVAGEPSLFINDQTTAVKISLSVLRGEECAPRWMAAVNEATLSFLPSHLLLLAPWARSGRNQSGARARHRSGRRSPLGTVYGTTLTTTCIAATSWGCWWMTVVSVDQIQACMVRQQQ